VYGRLDPLLDAWEELIPPEGPPICLVIAGDGPDLERYRRRAERAGGAVAFLGGLPRADALAALKACDIGYSDCWSEAGFPAKIFEYLSLGLPVVTKATPQASEVLEHEHDALLYESGEELVELLRRLVADPGLRTRLGEAARDTFRDRHTVAHRQQEFEALLARPPNPLTIRPLVQEDLARLFRGHARVFGEEWLERQDRAAAYVAVAELDGALVGRVGLDLARAKASGTAYLSSAYVQRKCRSHGVGTALCLHLEDVARDRGFRAIQLGVNKENHRARQLYVRLGYDVCGEEVVRWTYRRLGRTVEVVEDCSAMQKVL
jgi:ribosomal protein S18 acetylase RimI-like enzyme